MDDSYKKAKKIAERQTGDHIEISGKQFYVKWVDNHFVEDKEYDVFEFSLDSPNGEANILEVVFDEENEKFIGYYLNAKDLDEKEVA